MNVLDTWRGWSRSRREWTIVAGVLLATFVILAILSHNPDRAARDGWLAGIGWRYLQSVLLTMLVWAFFATGLELQFGQTGLLNFGHVLFLGIGAYSAAVLTWRFGDGWDTAGIGVALGAAFLIVVVATAISIVMALVLGLPTLRLREDYLAIVTIGAAEIMRLFWTNEVWLTNGPKGLSVRMPGGVALADGAWGDAVRSLHGIGLQLDPYFTFLILLVGSTFAGVHWTIHRLIHSPWGRVLKAMRENEDVAAALGKNPFLFKVQSLAVGGVIAGLAGIAWAWSVRFVTPQAFLPLFTFYAWIIVVVGGAGNPKSAIVGAAIVWGLFEGARQTTILQDLGLASTSGPEQVALIGLLLVLIMRFRPQGIMGRKEELRVGR